MTVALCFEYFSKKNIDIAIIETGLGGRLDSTNVITPILSVITNIGFDHMNILGNTIPKIAAEKAGIIKKNIPVVIGETDPKTKKIFLDKAKAMKSEIVFADKKIKTEEIKNDDSGIKIKVFDGNQLWFDKLKLSLAGHYQLKNVSTVLESVKLLRRNIKIKDEAILEALADIQGITGFSGRWQIAGKHPTIILDTGHNAHGLSQSMAQLENSHAKRLFIVFGVVKDKKLDDIIPLLPEDAFYCLCAPELPRALPVEDLTRVFIDGGFHYIAYKSVVEAYKLALRNAKKNDTIFVGGSTFVVAEVLEYLEKKREK
jgi:dihydrofolate synthase/folylpolyglutamate synthase